MHSILGANERAARLLFSYAQVAKRHLTQNISCGPTRAWMLIKGNKQKLAKVKTSNRACGTQLFTEGINIVQRGSHAEDFMRSH